MGEDLPRLPARVEAMGLIRSVAAAGGMGTVLHKGDPDAGTLLLILQYKGVQPKVYERMPQASGARTWICVNQVSWKNTQDASDYAARRAEQDPDLWIIELDIAHAERFIGLRTAAD